VSRRRKTNELVENLQDRLDTLPDRGYDAAQQLVRDTVLVIRRGFGEDSLYLADCRRIHFRPTDGIYDSGHYMNSGAWNDGVKQLGAVLHSMRHEISDFGLPAEDAEGGPERVTISWLVTHVSWSVWAWFVGALITAFTLSVALAHTTFVRELLGKP
jgi:hypothetical protein